MRALERQLALEKLHEEQVRQQWANDGFMKQADQQELEREVEQQPSSSSPSSSSFAESESTASVHSLSDMYNTMFDSPPTDVLSASANIQHENEFRHDLESRAKSHGLHLPEGATLENQPYLQSLYGMIDGKEPNGVPNIKTPEMKQVLLQEREDLQAAKAFSYRQEQHKPGTFIFTYSPIIIFTLFFCSFFLRFDFFF